MLGVGILTVKFDSPSIAELTWHDRNWCVRYLTTIHFFSLAHRRVPFAKQVVIKSERRCENMVRVHYVPCRKEMNSSCQVWCRANRDVGLDDAGVYPRDTIRDARLPVLDTGTIQ